MRRIRVTALALLVGVVSVTLLASGRDNYEVWAIDQSNSPGTTFGGTLYVWDGHDLERSHLAASAPVEKIDLGGATAALCLARTGANPVRPHMMAMNPAQTHAVISFVATGHVVFMDAATRQPVACFRTSPGAGGVRQAHMSTPSPDGTYVTVANQNGKLFERILTNYAHQHVRSRHGGNAEPCHLHDSERAALRDGGAATRQRPDLSDHRIHQPLHVRHTARRRAVRRRQPGHSHADRRGVRHQHCSWQRMPGCGGAWQDVHRLGWRDGCQPAPGGPVCIPGRRILQPQPSEYAAAYAGLQRCVRGR